MADCETPALTTNNNNDGLAAEDGGRHPDDVSVSIESLNCTLGLGSLPVLYEYVAVGCSLSVAALCTQTRRTSWQIGRGDCHSARCRGLIYGCGRCSRSCEAVTAAGTEVTVELEASICRTSCELRSISTVPIQTICQRPATEPDLR